MITFDFDTKDIQYLKADYDLKTVAKAVREDIEENLIEVRSYDGSQIAPLKKSYADMKYKKLRQARIFDGFRKGSKKLINSIKMKKINDNHYQIYVSKANDNENIMKYLQEGKSPLNGPRRAFGMGKAGVQRIAVFLEEALTIKANGR
jgi:nicotinic acid phosphoribosyltransferase